MRRAALLALLLLCALAPGGCAMRERPDVPDLILRYADNQPEDYPTTLAAKRFAELVEQETGGRVRIRVFADGALGDEISVYRQAQFGGIDFARVSTGALGEFFPEAEILQLPYLFEDAPHMWRVLDGEIGDELLEKLGDTGVVGLSWFDAGTRNIYTRERVRGLDDLAGLVIRVQESDAISRMVRLWGASPVKIPYSGVYSALQTSKIDGAENNWPSYEASGHFEAAPYYLLDGHSRLAEVMIVSSITMEKIRALDGGFEEIILRCAREAAQYERELWQEREAASEALVRERGCVVTELSAAERQRFRDAVQPMYDSFSGEKKALIERIRRS